MRKALPGIFAAFGFGLARAFGETMAVLMVVGNVVKLPKNVFDPGYTLPSLIANNYGEMLSIPRYDSALMFAALILLGVSLFFNLVMHFLIDRYNKY
jgi:phosphate transport system permease protein